MCADGIVIDIHPQAFEVERAGVACNVTFNPHRRRITDPVMLGPEWTTDKTYGKSRTRLCFANASHEAIRAGIATLAEVCRAEFGVPNRIANVERARA